MTTIQVAARVDRRQMLRRQLQAQRQVIAQLLGPAPVVNSDYPRSMTMRFLTRRSVLVTRLLGEFATLLIGARFMKSMSTAMTLSRIARSGSTS